jgi:tetratricopeptide (TPR) repeat protein
MRQQDKVRLCVSLGVLCAAGAAPIAAQSLVLSMPRASQRAVVSQRLGLTDITITYHRPLAGERKIWDGVVPYGKVWRAGANENTTIEFTDPVTIEGQPLAKGIYGLHMMPGADVWTIIFSKNSTSWGSFSYDQAEDALRVTAKPQPAEFHDALQYDFDQVKPDSTLVTLRWEKLAVPFRITVNDKELALQKVRNQLRDLPQYTWMSWDDAATYCEDNKVNLEEALRWADKSIQSEERFENLHTKALLLKDVGRSEESAAALNRALALANPLQLYFFGRQLQGQKQKAEALDVFRMVAKRFPDHWLGHLALARVNSAAGDFPTAVKEIKAAQAAGVADPQKQQVESLLHRLEANQDINN